MHWLWIYRNADRTKLSDSRVAIRSEVLHCFQPALLGTPYTGLLSKFSVLLTGFSKRKGESRSGVLLVEDDLLLLFASLAFCVFKLLPFFKNSALFLEQLQLVLGLSTTQQLISCIFATNNHNQWSSTIASFKAEKADLRHTKCNLHTQVTELKIQKM